jgi:hypothetical protein
MTTPRKPTVSSPEYGPGGYLPPKAAKRARKIILREQMGWGWPLAAVAAALVVVVAGVLFLRGFTRAPAAPFVAVGSVSDVPLGGAAVLTADEMPALVVRAGGTLRAFQAQHATTVWCPESQRLESPDSTWRLDGARTFGAGESLQPLDVEVFAGVIYVDFTTEQTPAAVEPGSRPPSCLRMG